MQPTNETISSDTGTLFIKKKPYNAKHVTDGDWTTHQHHTKQTLMTLSTSRSWISIHSDFGYTGVSLVLMLATHVQ